MRLRIAIVSLLVMVLTASAQDFQIRTRVDLVVVPVTVKASGDKLINGLQKDDFVVFEDGQRQTITNFTSDPVPLSAAVVIDTGLSADSLAKVQQTFPALAGAFSQFDEVAAYRFDKDVVKLVDFTKNPEALEAALKPVREIKPDTRQALLPGGPFSTIGPVINGAAVVPPGQVGSPVTQNQPKIKVLNDAIYAAAADLEKRERNRRKIVLVVSDGVTNGSTHSFQETVNSLLDFGIEVHAITVDQTALTKKFTSLNDYAKSTGGDSYYVGSSIQSIETAYARAAEQARNQYVLGYVSENKPIGKDPIFRNIEVKLARADYATLHRTGYYQYPQD
jgi:VWFA-related protein